MVARACGRSFLIVLILMIGISNALLFAGGQEEVAEEQITLRIANINSIESANGQMMKKFAELVEGRTDGNVKMLLFPGGQLGSEIENIEALMTGSLDMCIVGYGQLSAYVPEVAMADIPYFWKSEQHIIKFWESDVGKDFLSRYEEATGIRALCFNGLAGPRHILAKKPVQTPEDLKGVKIRVTQGYKHHYDGLLAMGGTPVYMAFTEIYTALQQGVIDAMENPIDDIYSAKFHEIAKYISLTAHIQNSMGILISKSAREKLDSDTLEILTDAAKEAGEYKIEVVHNIIEDAKKKMIEAGVTVIEPNREAFAELVRAKVHPQYIEKYPNGQEIYDKIQALE